MIANRFVNKFLSSKGSVSNVALNFVKINFMQTLKQTKKDEPDLTVSTDKVDVYVQDMLNTLDQKEAHLNLALERL
jgi:hypothetical protein